MQPFLHRTASTSAATCVRYPGYPLTFQALISEGERVKKRELLHLHMLMFHIRMYCEGITHDEIRTGRYNSLGISPLHIHKDKNAHKEALLTLGDEIVSQIPGRALPAAGCFPKAAFLPLAAAEL